MSWYVRGRGRGAEDDSLSSASETPLHVVASSGTGNNGGQGNDGLSSASETPLRVVARSNQGTTVDDCLGSALESPLRVVARSGTAESSKTKAARASGARGTLRRDFCV